jgi:K+-sensing histidine kinase KdpD
MVFVGHDDADSAALGLAIGGLSPIVVAALLVPVRDVVLNANLALAIVVVVVVAAMVGGRGAGVLAAVMSAVSFDFFLTRLTSS